MRAMQEWHLYVLRTARGALYTGITTDVARRLHQHACGKGAKALRARGPLDLVYSVALGARGEALRVEYALKQLAKARKEALVAARLGKRALCIALGPRPVTRARRRTGSSDS